MCFICRKSSAFIEFTVLEPPQNDLLQNTFENQTIEDESTKFSYEIIHECKNSMEEIPLNLSFNSMTAKFNSNGDFLAFHVESSMNEIRIVSTTNWNKTIIRLLGHRNIIHDINWINDFMLVSASSDCTAIVWRILDEKIDFNIILHSTFVYCVHHLNIKLKSNTKKSRENVIIASGGRDGILRIWKIILNKSMKIRLIEEHKVSKSFISSMATTKNAKCVYVGCVNEWNSFDVMELVQSRHFDKSIYTVQRY